MKKSQQKNHISSLSKPQVVYRSMHANLLCSRPCEPKRFPECVEPHPVAKRFTKNNLVSLIPAREESLWP